MTVDSFVESAIKKSIFDIKLVNGPGRRNSDTKNYTNGAGSDDMRKGFIEVNPMLLGETTAYPTSFITSESAIRVKFMTEDPFTRNNIGVGGFGNERPCVVLEESIKFLTHSRMPERVEKSMFVGFWDWGDRYGSGGRRKI